jgi:hypothetical protein
MRLVAQRWSKIIRSFIHSKEFLVFSAHHLKFINNSMFFISIMAKFPGENISRKD